MAVTAEVPAWIAEALGPRRVGGRYRDHYWGEEYTVLAIDYGDTNRRWSITEANDEELARGTSRTHCTRWDPRDSVVAEPVAALPSSEENPMVITTTTTRLAINAVRWRLLNRLGTVNGSAVVRANELLVSQDGDDADLLWLGENQLVVATLIGRTTRLDLVEHLTHHGSSMVLALRLNTRGRQVLQAWQNRVLHQLFSVSSHKMPLRTLLANAGVAVDDVANLLRRRMVATVVRSTGEAVEADDLHKLPATTLTVRLTDKGRTYLPL